MMCSPFPGEHHCWWAERWELPTWTEGALVPLGTVKKRDVPFYGPNQIETVEYRGGFNPPPPTRTTYDVSQRWRTLWGTQVTESENHPDWRKGGRWENLTVFIVTPDTGGDFTMQKTYVQSPVMGLGQKVYSAWTPTEPYGRERRESEYYALLPLAEYNMPFPPSARSSDGALAALGTTAISRCAPTNNVANLATAVGEFFQDGIPKFIGSTLWKSRTSNLRTVAKSSGDEYLNSEFGWKPLVADVSDLAKGVIHLNKLVTQYIRDSGKVVRRRYAFPPVQSTVTTVVKSNTSAVSVSSSNYNSLFDYANLNKGIVYRDRETTINQWFSGAFTYHLPSDTGEWMGEHVAVARKVLGGDLTPEVLWEITPWSWAIDWFTNVGDLVKNTSAWSNDGLVLKYGYIMEHSVVRDTYTFVGPTGYLTAEARPLPITLVTETKLRRRATPFGFGLNIGSFTNRQKAIVAALGLSRMR